MKMALSPPGFSDPFGEYPASGTQLAHAAPTIWGVDAEVFGAVVQAILAGLTLVAVGTAIWVAFREGRHREQDRQEELAGQARTISVELERQFGSSMGTFYVVVVQNHGNAQITDIVLQDIRVVFDGKANEPLWSVNDQSTPPVALSERTSRRRRAFVVAASPLLVRMQRLGIRTERLWAAAFCRHSLIH